MKGEKFMSENQNIAVEQNTNLKRYKVISNVLLIIALIGYVVVTAFLTYWLVDSLTLPDENDVSLNLAFLLVFGVIIVGGIGYIAVFIISLSGLIMTIAKKKQGVSKGRLAVFIIMTVLPILSEIIYIVLCVIGTN